MGGAFEKGTIYLPVGAAAILFSVLAIRPGVLCKPSELHLNHVILVKEPSPAMGSRSELY